MLHEPPPEHMLLYLVSLNKLCVEHLPISESDLARNNDTTKDQISFASTYSTAYVIIVLFYELDATYEDIVVY